MTLIYDIADSRAATGVLYCAIVATILTALWVTWLKTRGDALHAGVKFLGVIALVLFALSAGTWWEQRVLVSAEKKFVEGPVESYWTQRQKRAGKSNEYWTYEGFTVSGIRFAYALDMSQNYFHNAGSLPIRDGMRVRIGYIIDGDRNQILRFELAN